MSASRVCGSNSEIIIKCELIAYFTYEKGRRETPRCWRLRDLHLLLRHRDLAPQAGQQLPLLEYRSIAQDVLRIVPYVDVADLHRMPFDAEYSRLEFFVPLDLRLDSFLHADLVEVNFVHKICELFDQSVLPQVS